MKTALATVSTILHLWTIICSNKHLFNQSKSFKLLRNEEIVKTIFAELLNCRVERFYESGIKKLNNCWKKCVKSCKN